MRTLTVVNCNVTTEQIELTPSVRPEPLQQNVTWDLKDDVRHEEHCQSTVGLITFEAKIFLQTHGQRITNVHTAVSLGL
jgi:hypothetical protein